MEVKTLKQIEAEILKLREQSNAILEKESKEKHIPELKKYIGQCFIYKNNCYSCPQKKSDYWDEFLMVIDFVEANGYSYFILEKFRVDRNGEAQFKVVSEYFNADGRKPFDGWREISKKIYLQKEHECFAEMDSQAKMRRFLAKDK